MYETLFGSLAATGMRISEALSLQLDDLTADGLIIRQTKFHKSRLLPLHATTRDALETVFGGTPPARYLQTALFVSAAGASPAYSTVIAIFLQLARSIGLRGGPGQPGPCIHDLRHTFAVRSLAQSGTIAMPSPAISLRSAPISAMPTSPTPTGTCRRRRS